MAGTARRLLRSFAGGEIAPEMYGRIDLDKMQTGLGRCLNFEVLPHGPIRNRAGFQFVNEVKDSTKRVRLLPFAYSAEQTMVLEIGDQYIRFHTAGQTLLNTAQAVTAVANTNPGVIAYTGTDPVVGGFIYLADIAGMPAISGRFFRVLSVDAAANTVQLHDLAGQPVSLVGMPVFGGTGTMSRVYEIASPWLEADIAGGALHWTQSADVLTLVNPSYQPRELRRLAATNWSLSTMVVGPSIAAPASTTVATGGPGGGTPVNHYYKTTAVSADTLEESVASPASSAANVDLSVAGNYVDVTPAAVSGALRFNVYKRASGGLYGYIGQSDGSAFRDDNIVPDVTQTPPESSDPFSGAGNWPSTVTYIEQRRAFAATDNRPSTIWLTKSATESNFSQSVPLRDDDAIVATLKAMQQSRIRHLVPLNDLLALTVKPEFRVYAANSDVFTPSTVTPKAQSYVGANNIQPVLAENAVIYAQATGGHMREFSYTGEGLQGSVYSNNDISVLAPHLFDGFEIVDIAYSGTSSCPIVWVVRSDGVLLGLTYVPGQNVRAWHQHATQGGLFESICCVTEGAEDVLYAVVKRTVGGRDVRYIERLHNRQLAEQADAFHVDSGLTYDGPPATTITGLWHLEGEAAVALADGAVVDGLTVTAGSISLPEPASKVHVGLPITSVMQTLPMSYQSDEAFGQGVVKNVNEVHLRVSRSGSMHVGPTDGRLVEVKRRTAEPYGSPPALRTGWDSVNVTPRWSDDAGVTLEMRAPLPLTVLSMVLSVSTGG